MDETRILKPTSLEEIAEYSRGQIVELPPFAEGMPFVARLRRPSMMALAKAGKIPNMLLDRANKIFFPSNGTTPKLDKDSLAQTFEVIEVICDAAFVEPSYSKLKKLGIELTDDQYMFIFNYTQRGVSALGSFRTKQGNTTDIEVGEPV